MAHLKRLLQSSFVLWHRLEYLKRGTKFNFAEDGGGKQQNRDFMDVSYQAQYKGGKCSYSTGPIPYPDCLFVDNEHRKATTWGQHRCRDAHVCCRRQIIRPPAQARRRTVSGEALAVPYSPRVRETVHVFAVTHQVRAIAGKISRVNLVLFGCCISLQTSTCHHQLPSKLFSV